MPACRQCGKENPGGTTVCVYCATLVSADPKVTAESEASSQVHKVVFSPPPLAAKRIGPIQSAPPKPSKGIQWIPWSELSGGQKAGRAIAAMLAVVAILFLLRTFLGRLKLPGDQTVATTTAQSSEPPLTAADRADGLASICPTIKIYGLPKNDDEALNVANHSEDLFKLPGDRSVARSIFILTSLAHEFQRGSLAMSACPPPSAPAPNQMPAAASSPGK